MEAGRQRAGGGSREGERVAAFQEHRPLLFSIAYRMLGEVADAEDVVQEAFLRWRGVDEEIRSPRAYLSSIVTRLSIDQLRREKARRERYVGPWLPEPLVGEAVPDRGPGVAESAILDESLSMAFMVLLESLNPVERAVFLLREVFGYDYPEVARIVGKSEANCRQISHRARRSVSARRPRFDTSPQTEQRLLQRFLQACTSGDMEDLISVLSQDVTLWTDGGGNVRAARNPIYGADRVARFLMAILREIPAGFAVRVAPVNGRAGFVGYLEDGRAQSVVTLDMADGRIQGIRVVVNPEKLAHVPPLSSPEAG